MDVIDYQHIIGHIKVFLKVRIPLNLLVLIIYLQYTDTNIIMRKILTIMTALLLPLFAFNMSADDEDAVMKIPLRLEQGPKLNRSLDLETVECCYFGLTNSIITTFFSDLGEVILTVTNCYTGYTWYESFDSVQESHAILSISGDPGIYQIVYVTEYGDVYEGTFTIQ